MARAAGIFRFRGGASGDPTNGANYIDVNGNPWTGHYPGWDGTASANVDGDIVTLDGLATNAMAGGDLSAKGKLASFSVTNSYLLASNGAVPGVGTSTANPVKLNMLNGAPVTIDQADGINISGGPQGNIYLKGLGSHGMGAISVLTVKKSGTAAVVYLDGAFESFRGEYGNVEICATAAISGAYNPGFRTDPINDLIITIDVGATIGGQITVNGGKNTCNIAVSGLLMTNGTWIHQAGNLAAPNVQGGTLYWNGGNATDLLASNSGKIDGSQSDTPRTCSKSATPYAAQATFGGQINLATQGKAITVTDPIYPYKGQVTISDGIAFTLGSAT